MTKVKSLEDLKRVREEALSKRSAKVTGGQKQITVGMGTVGIAAGARETLKAILEYVEEQKLGDILVRQVGNIGLDSSEPIVQVQIGEEPIVTYGKVNPVMAREIMEKHVVGGSVVKEYLVG
jgi:NADP-reducing hydrogenase subunit HndB